MVFFIGDAIGTCIRKLIASSDIRVHHGLLKLQNRMSQNHGAHTIGCSSKTKVGELEKEGVKRAERANALFE